MYNKLNVGKINTGNSTGNSTGNNLSDKDEKIRKQLIGRIYAETDISKFRYEMLTYETDLQKILRNKYYVSINFCGTNSLLVFTKIQDKFYSFTVERQTLSYNFSKVDFAKVNINLVNIPLDDQIYNGTIFEGILVKRHNNSDVYIISDVFKFCGRDMTKDKLNLKLLTVVEYLRNNYDNDRDSGLELEVNKLFELNKFDHFIDNILPKSKNLKYRGICFYPEISETKLIYSFSQGNSNDSDYPKQNQFGQNQTKHNQFGQSQTKQNQFGQNQIKQNQFGQSQIKQNHLKNNMYLDKTEAPHESETHVNNIEEDDDEPNSIPNNKKSDKKFKYVNESDEDVFAVLDVKQTDKIDVYKLYCVEKEISDKKIKYKRINMGIAHIKGIVVSHLLKKIFADKKSALMKCRFNNDNSKWEPIEEETKRRIPTMINEIDEKLVQMEFSEDDSD